MNRYALVLMGLVYLLAAQPGLAKIVMAQPLVATTAAPAGEPKWLSPSGTSASGRVTYNDGEGFRWDLNCYNGCLEQGTNYVFSSSAYLQINGSSFSSPSSRAKKLPCSDGVEYHFGPYKRGSLVVYRRVKFFKSGLARFVDSYYNPTASDQIVRAEIRSNANYGMRNVNEVGKDENSKPVGVVLDTHNDRCPQVLMMARGTRSEQPGEITATMNSSNYYIRWSKLKVPASGVASTAYFFRQDNSADDLAKFATGFQPRKWMKDLPAEMRASVVNYDLTVGSFHVSIPRSTLADRVELVTGNAIYGTIRNTSFQGTTPLGGVTLEAKNVVGLARAKDAKSNVGTVLLTDGQVLTGTWTNAKLTVEVPGAGVLTVPFSSVRSFGFVINKERPEEIKFQGPYLGLRSGMRIRFTPETLVLKLKRSVGVVALPQTAVSKIDCPPNAPAMVMFQNRSVVAGELVCELKPVVTKLFGPKAIKVGDISSIAFSERVDQKATAPVRIQCNKEVFYGEITAKTLKFITPYGECDLTPTNIASIGPDPSAIRKAAAAASSSASKKAALQKTVAASLQKVAQLHSACLQAENNHKPYWIKKTKSKAAPGSARATYKKRCETAKKALDAELAKLKTDCAALWALGSRPSSSKVAGFTNYAKMWTEKVKKAQANVVATHKRYDGQAEALKRELAALTKMGKEDDATLADAKASKADKVKASVRRNANQKQRASVLAAQVNVNTRFLEADYAIKTETMSKDFYEKMLAAYTAKPAKMAVAVVPTKASVAVRFAGSGTTLVGRFVDPTVTVKLAEGVLVPLVPSTITAMVNTGALPAGVVNATVAKLISQLGAGNYTDRKAAYEALKKMGKGIKPLLVQHSKNPDAEVRSKIEELLKGL